MKDAILCFLIDNSSPDLRVLLGWKKRGFGRGKYVGMGGKIEDGETLKQATTREIKEEINVFVDEDDLSYAGRLLFKFPHKPSWDHDVHVFVTEKWIGDPHESDEIQPGWFSSTNIPYGRMWDDAQYWLPQILSGQVIEAHFTFQADNGIVATAQVNKISQRH